MYLISFYKLNLKIIVFSIKWFINRLINDNELVFIRVSQMNC